MLPLRLAPVSAVASVVPPGPPRRLPPEHDPFANALVIVAPPQLLRVPPPPPRVATSGLPLGKRPASRMTPDVLASSLAAHPVAVPAPPPPPPKYVPPLPGRMPTDVARDPIVQLRPLDATPTLPTAGSSSTSASAPPWRRWLLIGLAGGIATYLLLHLSGRS